MGIGLLEIGALKESAIALFLTEDLESEQSLVLREALNDLRKNGSLIFA